MPAFSFEKISPPPRRVSSTPAEKKRGVIVQILDRLVERRGKRGPERDPAAPVEPEAK